jgi:hypothetical protein
MWPVDVTPHARLHPCLRVLLPTGFLLMSVVPPRMAMGYLVQARRPLLPVGCLGVARRPLLLAAGSFKVRLRPLQLLAASAVSPTLL